MLHLKRLLLAGIVALLGACAASPTIFNQPMPGAPDLTQVNQNIDRYKGSRVRWGGVIASLKNQQDETWIELVQYQLDRRGRPVDGDSQGRFFVKIAGFLEPSEYAIGREITAVGEVTQTVTQKIGQHNYVYPVVSVSGGEFVLWDKLHRRHPYPYSGLYYDPFYDPFYDGFYGSSFFFYPYFNYGFSYGFPHRYIRYPRYVY